MCGRAVAEELQQHLDKAGGEDVQPAGNSGAAARWVLRLQGLSAVGPGCVHSLARHMGVYLHDMVGL